MGKIAINRKPIFDELRRILGRGFTPVEVTRIDGAIERALRIASNDTQARLGALSAQFESGGRGAGTVSSGANDPGGVSYGTYQLASKTGSVAAFLAEEGRPWAAEFGKAAAGTEAFSNIWRAIAARDLQAFDDAQYAFIERTHYRPVVAHVLTTTGLNLDTTHQAVRDAVWSVSVQHGGAAGILKNAVAQADEALARSEIGYARELLLAIYAVRTAYVLRVASQSGAGAARTLKAITTNRYPKELKAALAMLDAKSS